MQNFKVAKRPRRNEGDGKRSKVGEKKRKGNSERYRVNVEHEASEVKHVQKE